MSDVRIVPKQDSINLALHFGEYLYNRLPKVYRDYDVEIERFNEKTQKTEIFKTLQEYLYSFALGGFQPLLEDIEAIITLVDPFKCPTEFFPYLLRHFGLDYIGDIPEKFQRRLVQNIVTLYKKKGTIPAVAFLAKELSGFDVEIEERSDGSIEFALIRVNAYEDENAELLLAQNVIQRYIHLFLPAQTKSKIIVVYGFTENVHINAPKKSEDTQYDHAYYKTEEFVFNTNVKEGDYDEAFDYLEHVVEAHFHKLKLQLEHEENNFNPYLPDLTSLTNMPENEGLPVFTNGISCEDTITTQSLTSSTGSIELNIPASSKVAVNKLVGNGELAVLPIYKCYTDLHKGATLEFKYNGKSYGYYTLERDLYASNKFPTTFQLDIYNNLVKVYNQYTTETIDETYDFSLFTGYNSYYTYLRNGFIASEHTDDIRVVCDYEKGFAKQNSAYFQPSDTPKIAFTSDNRVYISLSNVIISAESATQFVSNYPITLVYPIDRLNKNPSNLTIPNGYTIAIKKLSSTPINESMTVECSICTLDKLLTYFAYESPVFMQNSNLLITDEYGNDMLYDLGVPLISFGGYSESIEKIAGKYYIRSAIKELDLNFMQDNISNGINDDFLNYGTFFKDLFDLPTAERLPFYYNMSPCNFDVDKLDTKVYNSATDTYVDVPNCNDAFDFLSFRYVAAGFDFIVIGVNQFRQFNIDNTSIYNDMFKYSDIPPKLYLYDKDGIYGGETLTEITDSEVINKLNLLPIPENYAIISSKGIKYPQMDIGVQSKQYY